MMAFDNPLAGLDDLGWHPCANANASPPCDREPFAGREYCSVCSAAIERDAAMNRASREAIERIDPRYRWADRSHPKLVELVGPIRFRDDLAKARAEAPSGPQGAPQRPEAMVAPVPVQTALRRILEAPEPLVLLRGPSRAGKSLLAAALYRASVTACGGWMEWHDAVELAEAPLESELGSRASKLLRAERCRLLVVDELRDPKHATKAANLFGVINARHRAGGAPGERSERRTIVTTGMSNEQMAATFGTGGLERLTEPGSALVVHMWRREGDR